MKTLNLKTNDEVLVITGKDKGKKGKILSINNDANRITVEGVNVVSKHKKPKSAQEKGGIFEEEASIDASNVKIVCPSCQKPSRIGKKVSDNGNRIRVCKKCGEELKKIKTTKKTTKKSASKSKTSSNKKNS